MKRPVSRGRFSRFNARMAYRLEHQDEATREALIALGSVFLELRRSRGLTQRQLAGRCGLSQSSISRLETGKAPSLSAIWIARMLACLDIAPGILGFTSKIVEDPEPSWRRLMARFESRRRHREYNSLIYEANRRRERRLAAAKAEDQRLASARAAEQLLLAPAAGE